MSMKKNILILFLLVGSVSIYAQSGITIRGKVVDHHSNIGIEGVSIVPHFNRIAVQQFFSDENGNFEFTLNESFNAIFIAHKDYLVMVIRWIDVSNKTEIDFCFPIPLFENPFIPFSDRRLTRAEQREYRELQSIMARRLGSNQTIRYSRRGQFQYIRFADLINCTP